MSDERAKQDEIRKAVAVVRWELDEAARRRGKKLNPTTDKQVLDFVNGYLKTESGKRLMLLHEFEGKEKPH